MTQQRWFVNTDNNGSVEAVYKSTWDGSRILSEEVWSRANNAWQQTRTVSAWNFVGDYRIDEVSAKKAAEYLPPIALQKSVGSTTVKGVAGPLEVERALSRLTILPNPNLPSLENLEDYVESPWEIVKKPTVNPALWTDAELIIVDLADLYATDPFLERKNVEKHIVNMGQSLKPFRSWAMVAESDGRTVIMDGHHRLMALWLLGHDRAPVYWIEVDG